MLTGCADEVHVTRLVRSRVNPLVRVATAVNCWACPAARDGVAGFTAILITLGSFASAHPMTIPNVTNTVANKSFFKEHLAFKESDVVDNFNHPMVSTSLRVL